MKYKIAAIVLLLYGVFVAAILAHIYWSSTSNAADSGESAVLLVFMASPWISILPGTLINPVSGLLCIFLNGAILSALVQWIVRYMAVSKVGSLYSRSKDHK